MITIRYELRGAFGPLAGELLDAAGRVVENTAEELARSIQASFDEPKSGEPARRDDGLWYQASAPGEPPAIKEGELFSSIEHGMADELTAVVWSDDEKAAWLNYGTAELAPRPFWEPAIDDARAAFAADMAALAARLATRR